MFIVRSLLELTLRAQLAMHWRALAAAAMMALLVIVVENSFAPPSGLTGFAIELARGILVGAVGYILSLGLLWALSGFVEGPERECLTLLRAAWLSRRGS